MQAKTTRDGSLNEGLFNSGQPVDISGGIVLMALAYGGRPISLRQQGGRHHSLSLGYELYKSEENDLSSVHACTHFSVLLTGDVV